MLNNRSRAGRSRTRCASSFGGPSPSYGRRRECYGALHLRFRCPFPCLSLTFRCLSTAFPPLFTPRPPARRPSSQHASRRLVVRPPSSVYRRCRRSDPPPAAIGCVVITHRGGAHTSHSSSPWLLVSGDIVSLAARPREQKPCHSTIRYSNVLQHTRCKDSLQSETLRCIPSPRHCSAV